MQNAECRMQNCAGLRVKSNHHPAQFTLCAFVEAFVINEALWLLEKNCFAVSNFKLKNK